MKTITVTVLPDGQVKVEASGFSGQECREATSALREALGAASSERLKPEFHQPAEAKAAANASAGN